MTSTKANTMQSLRKNPSDVGKLRRKLFAILILLVGLFPVGALAQTSALSGAVTDSTGAAVPGATINIRNIETGVSHDARAGEDGFYNVGALQPGRYTITVNAPGFGQLVRSGLLLQLDTSSRVDLELKPTSATQEVTVNADATLLQTDSPEFESHVTSQQFDDLPLVQQDRMRNPAAFVYLTPGVQGNISTNGSEYVGATNVIIANGSQQYSTELLLEGLPGGQSRVPGNYTESAPAVDSVREFKMTTTQLAAEYGHTGAAVGSFAVRSGTNQWHGSAYEYIRNSALDATNWLAKHTGTTQKLSKKQNEFGATIGGPIILPHIYNGREKSFFYFGYGGSRLAGGAAAFTTVLVPTLAQRQGNFSSAVYDPATTVFVNGNAVRAAFAGNSIPTARIDPVAAKILSYYPAPNINTTTGNNFGGYTGAAKLTPDTYTGKIDHQLTSKQSLSAVYVRTRVPRLTIGSPLGKPVAGDSFQVVAAHTLRLNHTYTITPHLLNRAFIGFNRFTNLNLPAYQDQDYTAATGLQGIPDSTYFPAFTFSTNGYAATGGAANANVPENDFYYKDIVTWSRNRHSISVGGEYRIIQFNDKNPFKLTGSFAFSSQQTATQSASSTTYSGGNSFASFLLGQVFSGSVTGPAQVYTRKRYTGFFIQDDYRATDRLTLNLGLRFEWQGAPREKNNAHSQVSLTGANPGAGNRPGVLEFASASRPTFFDNDYTAISPRLGFAFRATNSTAIRGGYGIFYTEAQPNTALNRSGYAITGSFVSPNGGSSPAFVLNNGVPQTYPSTATPTPTAINGQAGSYWEANSDAMPRTQEWTLSLQQSFGTKSSLEFIYIGTHGSRLVDPQMRNINQLDKQYWSLGSTLQTQVGSAQANAAGIKAPYAGFTGTVAQALRPYPQYLTLTSLAAKATFNLYNAGQIVYRHRTGFGLTFFGGYVWSKNLGYNSPSFDGQGTVDNVLQDATDPTAERSLLPQDVPHSVIFNYVYSLPFGKNQKYLTHGVGAALAGGWKISGIQRYQSGTPLFLLANNFTANIFFNRVTRPNVVPGQLRRFQGGAFNYDTDRLINPAAFTQPTSFTLGNSAPAYSDLRNFGSFTEDLSLVKDTRLTDHLMWSFYAQSNNTFNRHRFYGITTNINSTTTFGKPSNVSNPRYLQFGTRFRF